MAPKVSRIDAAGNARLGEGPHWDIRTKSLYFTDIFEGIIQKYDPATEILNKATVQGHEGKSVSIIIPIKDQPNKFLISVGCQLGVISWDGKAPTVNFQSLTEVDTTPDANGTQINDGKCDALGRIWFGTLGAHEGPLKFKDNGSFYSYNNGKTTQHFRNVTISNGLAWNKDNTKVYYNDSPTGKVDVFDYDLASGTISNRRTFSEAVNLGLGPDGITIDTDDNLWVAVFNASCVMKICGKTGKLMQKINLPAAQITSAAWGGDNLDELYVTSGRLDDNLMPPVHGSMYKITNTGSKGFPMKEAIL